MKKLVISDMDGTLLNNHQELGEYTKSVLRKLAEKKIVFAAASGRSRHSLQEHFKGIPFASVSDNGATVYNSKGELVWYKEIPSDTLMPMWEIILAHPFIHPVLCGLKNHYDLKSDSEEAKAKSRHFFNGHVESVENIVDAYQKDIIVKVSLHTRENGADEQTVLSLLRPYEKDFAITLSGEGWIDITAAGVTKGRAFERLCAYLGIAADDAVAFGDYLNDLDLLRRCPDSWCMKNGHPDVMKVCSHITSFTNNEEGVAKELELLIR